MNARNKGDSSETDDIIIFWNIMCMFSPLKFAQLLDELSWAVFAIIDHHICIYFSDYVQKKQQKTQKTQQQSCEDKQCDCRTSIEDKRF